MRRIEQIAKIVKRDGNWKRRVIEYWLHCTEPTAEVCKILDWSLWHDLSTKGCLVALNQALATLPKVCKGTLIHHSDRGIQYCSDQYTQRLLTYWNNKTAVMLIINCFKFKDNQIL